MQNKEQVLEYFKQAKEKRKKVWNFAEFYFRQVIKEETVRAKSGRFTGNSRENSNSRGRNVKLEPIGSSSRNGSVLRENRTNLP